MFFRLLAFWVLVFSPLGALAQGWDLDVLTSSLSEQERQVLLEEGQLSLYQKERPQIKWFPQAQENPQSLQTLEKKNANALVESFFYIPRALNQRQIRTLYNGLLGVSALEEIRYYNPEHDQHHRLFGFSHRVEGPGAQEPLEDIQILRLPPRMEIYLRQELLPVGPMNSKILITQEKGLIQLSLENTTNLNYGILPVIGRGAFFAEIRIYLGEDFTLFYGLGGINFFNPLNIFGDKIDPFFYRFQGIFDHYTGFMETKILED